MTSISALKNGYFFETFNEKKKDWGFTPSNSSPFPHTIKSLNQKLFVKINQLFPKTPFFFPDSPHFFLSQWPQKKKKGFHFPKTLQLFEEFDDENKETKKINCGTNAYKKKKKNVFRRNVVSKAGERENNFMILGKQSEREKKNSKNSNSFSKGTESTKKNNHGTVEETNSDSTQNSHISETNLSTEVATRKEGERGREGGGGGEGGGEGEDPGWLRAFPHAATAALANFCFGYHIGVTNGPLDSIALELGFSGDTIMQGFVVSIFLVGAFLGSFLGGFLADLVGRRRNFQLDTIPLILGSILSANAHTVEEMEAGRFLVGIGVGAAAGFVALYISEVAPTKYRGALGSLAQVGTCLGIIVALLVGIPAETDPHWWRSMFWIATIPAVLFAVGMQLAAESPRWLSKVGKREKARENLANLWGESSVEAAMAELDEAEAQEGGQEEATWGELLSPQYIKVATTGGLLFVLQQLAGINGVLYFSSATFAQAGIENQSLASAAVGGANLAGALTVLPLMDVKGRKVLLSVSYGGMALTMALLVGALVVPMPEDLSHILSVVGTLGYVYLFALGAGPVTALIIPELCSTRIRAKTLASSLCVHWVCNFFVGLFFLDAVQRFGVPVIYSGFGAVSLAAVVYANLFIIETKGRSLEDIERELSATSKR